MWEENQKRYSRRLFKVGGRGSFCTLSRRGSLRQPRTVMRHLSWSDSENSSVCSAGTGELAFTPASTKSRTLLFHRCLTLRIEHCLWGWHWISCSFFLSSSWSASANRGTSPKGPVQHSMDVILACILLYAQMSGLGDKMVWTMTYAHRPYSGVIVWQVPWLMKDQDTEWQVLKTLNNRRSVVHAISGKSEIWCTDERRISWKKIFSKPRLPYRGKGEHTNEYSEKPWKTYFKVVRFQNCQEPTRAKIKQAVSFFFKKEN